MRDLAVAILLYGLALAPAQAAGLTSFNVPTDESGPAFEALMWTPCDAPPGEIRDAGLVLPGIMDCPIAGSGLPLIVISHGGGGSPGFHYYTAATLADAGFAVVGVRHPNDRVYSFDISWLTARPTDVRRLVDYMLGPSPAAAKIDAQRIGFFGFSRGGYTGLVLAGAVPEYSLWMKALLRAAIWIFHRNEPMPPPKADPRLKAFVIVDPLSFFPDRTSLQAVTAPIQLWSSEVGGDGVTPERVAAIATDLPAKPEFHLVPNSAHPSFGFPCPPALAETAPRICTDPPGFDRAAFHAQFNVQVLAFLRRALPE